jgi:hypothetical protein
MAVALVLAVTVICVEVDAETQIAMTPVPVRSLAGVIVIPEVTGV